MHRARAETYKAVQSILRRQQTINETSKALSTNPPKCGLQLLKRPDVRLADGEQLVQSRLTSFLETSDSSGEHSARYSIVHGNRIIRGGGGAGDGQTIQLGNHPFVACKDVGQHHRPTHQNTAQVKQESDLTEIMLDMIWNDRLLNQQFRLSLLTVCEAPDVPESAHSIPSCPT